MILALADAAPLGGKAGGLARLIAAGLPVPDGVVVGPDAGEDEVRAAAGALAPLAVRSSMSLEDQPGAAAAGVFASRVDVAAADVWEAVSAVRDSAGAPLATAYAHLHDTEVRIAVILQRFVAGARVTVYTRPPGRPDADEVWIEPAGAPPRRVSRASPDAALALAAERAIGATGGADVELVVGAATWIVQARPIVHPPPPRTARPPPPALFAALPRGVTWRWDLGHNPDPLSPAQAALVAAVADPSLQLVAGYLYVSDSDPVPVPLPVPVPDLLRKIRALVTPSAPDLPTAVSHYVSAYHLYTTQLAPQITRTGRSGNLLLAAARGELTLDAVLARIGHHAPAWDVAVPTYAERPALVAAAIARLRALLPDLPPPAPVELSDEDDDVFALAQQHVRRALLDAGRALGLDDPADACWLDFDDLAAGLSPERAAARAAAARAAADRARAWSMPLAVRDGAPLPEPGGDEWRGAGAGGIATGVAHRIDDLGAAALVPAGTIAVVATVTPALALVLAGARAIVAAHGGILDHGAAIARELGIPCVVGCPAAWRALRDGDLVEVSGDAGLVKTTRR